MRNLMEYAKLVHVHGDVQGTAGRGGYLGSIVEFAVDAEGCPCSPCPLCHPHQVRKPAYPRERTALSRRTRLDPAARDVADLLFSFFFLWLAGTFCQPRCAIQIHVLGWTGPNNARVTLSATCTR